MPLSGIFLKRKLWKSLQMCNVPYATKSCTTGCYPSKKDQPKMAVFVLLCLLVNPRPEVKWWRVISIGHSVGLHAVLSHCSLLYSVITALGISSWFPSAEYIHFGRPINIQVFALWKDLFWFSGASSRSHPLNGRHKFF